MEYIVQTQNLSKYFGKEQAVSNINLQIRKGEIYGFLGPNG
ncbi:MAG TPA: bacitracin ABC transporter ATP-binding protein, partial [Lysinibacillus sp.]|nr:bacitracin ABC transporter ATP-binding protein [Lysinibacillus sp.]